MSEQTEIEKIKEQRDQLLILLGIIVEVANTKPFYAISGMHPAMVDAKGLIEACKQ